MNWLYAIVSFILILQGCQSQVKNKDSMEKIHLIVLDPGHFHAALVQKSMYGGIDSSVNVFAPEGSDVESYLKLIRNYNARADNPTSWQLHVYKGNEFLSRVLLQKPGSLVILAGNNRNKTEYIRQSVEAGFHVLSDKPMAITPGGFEILTNSFKTAENANVLLYDIMTSRYEITNILERELSKLPEIFGKLKKGTLENPAVCKQSTHHFFKSVSGTPVVRPAWYFDTEQEGGGIVDVTTHLIDLIQWECFPEQVLDYREDIRVLTAKRWPTPLSLSQFSRVTGLDSFPGYLAGDIKNHKLNVYSNGEINYTIKDVHAKVSVSWSFQAPEGFGDTYYSIMRGTKANLIIRQSMDGQSQSMLYIEPVKKNNIEKYKKVLAAEFQKIEAKFPGTTLNEVGNGWEVVIPKKFKIGHEQQFEKVTKTFLNYVRMGRMPEWEYSFMKSKYYTTTKALDIALEKK